MKEFIEKLIGRLEEYYDENEFEINSGFIEVCLDIVNQLAEEYNTIDINELFEEMEQNDGWIPCEKELPPMPKENPLFDNKPLELYLVSLNSTDYPWRAFWNGKFFADGWSKVEPIAWQPLPAPYQPKGE